MEPLNSKKNLDDDKQKSITAVTKYPI